jgi:amino acid transporter
MKTAAGSNRHLQRILGVTFGVAIGLGGMIGSGIMRTPSLVAGELPTAAWIVGLWVLGGLHAGLGTNIYAELSTAVPKDGGPYVFVHRAFGDVAGLLTGWADWGSYMASTAAASVSFGEFLSLLWPAATPHKAVIAVLLQAALYGANMVGLREGRALQEMTSLVKALLLFVFVGAAVAVAWVAPFGGHASVAPATVAPALGLLSLAVAYQMIVGAYAGWNGAAAFSEENADPARSIPKALFLGLLTTAILYVSINLGLLAALGSGGLAGSQMPFSAVLARIGGPLPGLLFAVGAMIVVASCANAAIMGGSRVLFALSRDGLLPGAFQSLNKGGSPDMAFLLCGAASVALAASGSFGIVFGLIGVLATVVGVLVDASFFVLRRREPELARPFRARLYPWLPGLLLVADATLLVLFSREDHVGIAVTFGLAAACVPFVWLARRVNFGLRSAGM